MGMKGETQNKSFQIDNGLEINIDASLSNEFPCVNLSGNGKKPFPRQRPAFLALEETPQVVSLTGGKAPGRFSHVEKHPKTRRA